MKIAVIGKGGREHALVKALKESPSAPEMYCFPGSDAINRLAAPIPARDLPTLIDWMVSNKVDLCVAGEESYLVKDEGLANACARVGIPCWGPVKESAQLEASKEFAKEFLLRHHIPTGRPVWPPPWRKPGNSSAAFTPPCSNLTAWPPARAWPSA